VGKRLLMLDTGLSNDHAIFGILRAQIRREPLAAEDRRIKADSCELASDVRCLDRASEHVGKMRDDFFWGVRRRKHAPPQIDFEAGESPLCDRWQVRERTISRHQSGAKRSTKTGQVQYNFCVNAVPRHTPMQIAAPRLSTARRGTGHGKPNGET
jgi:hypothetical protein